ncbi:formylglycine-generating enzyme family protein [Streptomyces sp. DSM 42041]|uniref:Formylglycine-generating enzyme family protein n=1 Tax=Streptomyces hazeniae TaxID=3075538 RepID=A0ABU2NLU2_9ACTN|nr:formylglycine-generating enzyme family protein [Streptomyces sp. DSM 42041]MDT0377949.1 formylglycine-generating enzyme family protein [Streptomyces sp. DSM 42041]
MSDPAPRACCAPARQGAPPAETPHAAAPSPGAPGDGPRSVPEPHGGWRSLDGGPFLMGSADGPYPADGEGPVREVAVSPFSLAATAVTVAEFAAFTEATGHTTDAERFGWSFVFAGFLPRDAAPTRGAAATPWWRQVFGADWNHPEGPGTDTAARRDHPVVHVSHADAVAYCAWAGVRLPTEAEWESAARGGLEQQPFPWGAERDPGGEPRMNIWRGTFPDRNTAADGYAATCPVDAFEANAFGLWNMTGNVWEWCADWFSPGFHKRGPRTDPAGPPVGQARVLRGGSHLCHESYCLRYRTSARMGNTPDSSSGNTGFRVAR